MKRALLCALVAVGALGAAPPEREPAFDLLHSDWPAVWVECPGYPPRFPGVFHFRKTIEIAQARKHFVVHVSADNRFILWVNGERVGVGPARGSPLHWRYETFDLGPLLAPGKNLLAATVWNFGTNAPGAQMSSRTGFIVQGDSPRESSADTDSSWKVEVEKGQGLLPQSTADIKAYYAAGPGELLTGRNYDWNWMSAGGDEPRWRPAQPVGEGDMGVRPHGCPWGVGQGGNPWALVPDALPPMEEVDGPMGRIVRSEGVQATAAPLTIGPRTHAVLLLDHGVMTTAYPQIAFRGGRDATVRLTYAEALVDAEGQKGRRGDIAGKSIAGLHDAFVADGGEARVWSTLWWRSWRYLQMEVQTQDQPLTFESMAARFTAYPFREKAKFQAGDPSLAAMWKIGVRTARLNAHDAYMDCPYYEQLQYVADTRIQALVSYTVFGDERLARQALRAFDDSMTSEGLTQSRFPSAHPQFIPTFSLIWIGMLRDYWMYRPDGALVRELVPHTRPILDWYRGHLRSDGLLGPMPWWNFADWADTYPHGIPPLDAAGGGSSVLALHYALALGEAADLENAAGRPGLAAGYRRQAGEIAASVYRLCWDEGQGLVADNPEKRSFSEQPNILAVLADAVPKSRQRALLERILAGEGGPPGRPLPAAYAPASLYFRFYLARAVDHAGLADRYLELLGPWRRMLDLGLTTWAEKQEPTRSDDHGWSAHPNYDLLTLVAGIRPDAPGFARVLIAPHPGNLKSLDASMPHPRGMIRVNYRLEDGGWRIRVELPPRLEGRLLWGDREVPLHSGANDLR